jgi:hypothetical protein
MSLSACRAQAAPALRLLDRGPDGGAARAREVLTAARGAVREELLSLAAAAAAAVLPMGDLGDDAGPAEAPAPAEPAERVQARRRPRPPSVCCSRQCRVFSLYRGPNLEAWKGGRDAVRASTGHPIDTLFCHKQRRGAARRGQQGLRG